MSKICHIEIQSKNNIPRVQRELSAAQAMGMETVVLCEGETFEENGTQYIGFPPACNRFDRFFRRSKQIFQMALQSDADIIQLHAPEYLLYALKLKRAGKKVIFDSHENYPTQILRKPYIPLPLRKLVSKVYAAFEAYICRQIDCVLYPCTINGKNFFEGRAKRSLKIENYSRAVPLNLSGERQMQAVHAGFLTEERGITKVSDAILKTTGKLVLCGPFVDEDYQNKITAYSSEKVDYRGLLDRKTLFEVYGTCAVGLSTLLPVGQYAQTDNLSTKMYEYMQCGLPVVASDFPFIKAENEKYHFGICVDPYNADEIAEAIQYLFDHPEEACQMGENGRRAVLEHYNWDVEAKKLMALYEELLKG